MSSILTYGTISEQGLSGSAKDRSFASTVPVTFDFGDQRLPPRFWSKVTINPETGCWEWTASVRRRGYGRYGGANNQLPAHRVSYEALIGPIPDGLQIDHLCRVTGCVNPAHLEPVTQQENIRRAKRVRGTLPDHCRRGHAYTPENTYLNPSGGYRVCRTCQNETWRRYDAAKRSGSTHP